MLKMEGFLTEKARASGRQCNGKCMYTYVITRVLR